MANIKIANLQHTLDHAILEQRYKPMRALRLKSLQTDAASFKSKYSDEIKQPKEFWLNRLRDEQADHWIAYDTTTPSTFDDQEEGYEGRFIAFLVVLSLGRQPVAFQSDEMSVTESACDHYQMAALFVDPDYRGKGLSATLMRSALDKIRDSMHGPTTMVTLSVREHNSAAVHVYKTLGFCKIGQEIEEGSGGEKDIMDVMRLEISPDPISKA